MSYKFPYSTNSKSSRTTNSNKEIKFVKKLGNKNDEFAYNPDKQTYVFYQICQFKNPKTNKHDVRCVTFNEHSDIINTEEYVCSSKYCDIIISKCNINEYKLYSTYDLNLVGLPQMDDLLRLQSSLLN